MDKKLHDEFQDVVDVAWKNRVSNRVEGQKAFNRAKEIYAIEHSENEANPHWQGDSYCGHSGDFASLYDWYD